MNVTLHAPRHETYLCHVATAVPQAVEVDRLECSAPYHHVVLYACETRPPRDSFDCYSPPTVPQCRQMLFAVATASPYIPVAFRTAATMLLQVHLMPHTHAREIAVEVAFRPAAPTVPIAQFMEVGPRMLRHTVSVYGTCPLGCRRDDVFVHLAMLHMHHPSAHGRVWFGSRALEVPPSEKNRFHAISHAVRRADDLAVFCNYSHRSLVPQPSSRDEMCFGYLMVSAGPSWCWSDELEQTCWRARRR